MLIGITTLDGLITYQQLIRSLDRFFDDSKPFLSELNGVNSATHTQEPKDLKTHKQLNKFGSYLVIAALKVVHLTYYQGVITKSYLRRDSHSSAS